MEAADDFGQDSAPGKRPSIWVDVLLFGIIVAVGGWVIAQAREWTAPLTDHVEIDLSPSALPGYAARSFGRGAAAYAVSLVLTLVFGTLAGRSRRAERVLLPMLDVLQGVPVLAFLPGLVLGMVALFPNSNVGLELACVLMIVTGQAWNMVFAYFASVRSVPQELRDISKIHRFSKAQYFGRVELSSSVIPLVWNSMMSMAGGWFFLMVNEAFTLGGHDFRLPGIGAYMSVAFERDDMRAVVYALGAMMLMILLSDQLIWRPLVAWSYSFKADDSDMVRHPRSWVFDLLRHSVVAAFLRRRREKRLEELLAGGTMLNTPIPTARHDVTGPGRVAEARDGVRQIVTVVAVTAGAVLLGVGVWRLVSLLVTVSPVAWLGVASDLGLTFLRITAAIAISALWTVPVGIWIGRRPGLARILSPVVQMVASFPAPMVFPLVTAAIIAAGIEFTTGCTLLMVLGAQWYLLFNVIAGAATIPHDLDEVANAYGLRGPARWLKVELPAVFPYLVTGLVTGAGGAWNASIVTEFQRIGGRTLSARGLGALLNEATIAGDFALLAAAITVMSAALILLNRLVWKRCYRLADERFSLQ